MSGNVDEWCLNEYNNPRGTGLSGASRRVVRGGSWDNPSDEARVSFSHSYNPNLRDDLLGLRVARSSLSVS
jgi:formylglycine-generating enzyme required for sulfatase activity